MAIVYECLCGHAIETRDENAGKLEKCPSCRMSVLVPEPLRPVPKTVPRRDR